MTTCGWCKKQNLQKTISMNGDGKGLETHTVPNSRKVCDGQSTAPGYQFRTKK